MWQLAQVSPSAAWGDARYSVNVGSTARRGPLSSWQVPQSSGADRNALCRTAWGASTPARGPPIGARRSTARAPSRVSWFPTAAWQLTQPMPSSGECAGAWQPSHACRATGPHSASTSGSIAAKTGEAAARACGERR
ncbi:MAG TPA: hypothetical protein DEF51_35580 [Myxococcales bacterium]|nr:hypothetical protein [Myxococcales bacterium]